MTHALPPLTKDLIEAFAASAVAWLVRLLGVLTAPGAQRRRRLMRRFLKHIERNVECIVFLWAVQQFGPLPKRRRRPRSVPPGFRRTMGSRRLFFKSARIRARGADPLMRVARLLEALANPERYIARFLRRFMNGVCFFHLVPCAPPAHACVSLARPDARFAAHALGDTHYFRVAEALAGPPERENNVCHPGSWNHPSAPAVGENNVGSDDHR